MKPNIQAFGLVLLLLIGSPAQAQISIPIPIPSIPLPFFGGRGQSQQHVDPREHAFVQYWNDAVALERADNYRAAIELWRKAMQIHPENSQVRLYLAQAYRQAGMTTAAIALGRQLLNTRPKDEAVWRLLLNSYIDSNQLEAAVATGQEFLSRFPGSKYRKTVEIDIANVTKELKDRGNAPGGAVATEDNYLPFACEEGVYRWHLEQMPLKVYIENGRGVRKWDDAFIMPVKQAFDQWSAATQGMVRFAEVNDAASADIVVQWDDGTKDLGHSGHAGPDHIDEAGWIRHAKVTLHTQVPKMHSDVTVDSVLETAQHEIGHALGLLGHSDRPNDMMYWSQTPVSHRISARDVRTLVRLYSVDASMIGADGKLIAMPMAPQQQPAVQFAQQPAVQFAQQPAVQFAQQPATYTAVGYTQYAQPQQQYQQQQPQYAPQYMQYRQQYGDR